LQLYLVWEVAGVLVKGIGHVKEEKKMGKSMGEFELRGGKIRRTVTDDLHNHWKV